MSEFTHDELLGKGRLVQPRPVPHGYQVEQWEQSDEAFKEAQAKNPLLSRDDFQAGWDAAFRQIYSSPRGTSGGEER